MSRIEELRNKLIVSCYADEHLNEYMNDSSTMARVALSCLAGGAGGIRTNSYHVSEIRKNIDKPLIGIRKIYNPKDVKDFRITPTMKEVDELVESGADGIAIDATIRERYDDLTLEHFIKCIKEKYPDLFVVGDISTLEEGIQAYKYGVDAVGTTLSGYTDYSKNKVIFGEVPTPDPDYELIRELRMAGVERVIAEGRIDTGTKLKKCFDNGAFAVVIGTSITEPRKIVKNLLYESSL